jgi:uncharacterized membrane protein
MEAVEQIIEVAAPADAVYQRWTEIEEFPRFMKHILAVRRIDDRRFWWRFELNGSEHEAEAEISLLIPERRMAWRSITGPENSGVVSFQGLESGATRVTLEMRYIPNGDWNDPDSLRGWLGDHLRNFKEVMEGSVVGEMVARNWQGF